MEQNPFWEYSLQIYAQPGVKSLLLELQEEYGADVNLLLCCCWLASESRILATAEMAALVAACAKWRGQCIIPLRGVREFLKSQSDGASDNSEGSAAAPVQDLYEQVKALELRAERWQQDLIVEQLSTLPQTRCEQDKEEIARQLLQDYCSRLPGVDWQELSAQIGELLVRV